MKKHFILFFLLGITQTISAQISTDIIKAIIQQEIAGKRSKSIIVGLVDANGRQIMSGGILSDANPVAPDGNTMYEIGSITKVFTTLLLAELSLKKKLDLNDPISKFLPKVVNTPVRNGKEISLLSLATHRAALPRNADNLDPQQLDNPFADFGISELYAFIANVQLRYDIDTKWQYSNIGYSLLGHIISLIAGEHFETLLMRDLCKPLNMRSTVITLTPELMQNRADGHSEYGRPAADWQLPLAGGGGLHSNVNDLLTFAAANLGLINSSLTPAMELCHLQQAKKDGNDSYVTLGWTLWNEKGKQILFKDGGTGGYRTFIGIDKKNKRGVVVLTNSNNIVTDIGLHILDSTSKLRPYRYAWHLLDTLRTRLNTDGTDAAIALYEQLKESKNRAFTFNEHQLNYLGNELRRNKKTEDAIKIYELNIKEYPKSALVYENLGETFKRNGVKSTAILYFEKALSLDTSNTHLSYILKKLKSN